MNLSIFFNSSLDTGMFFSAMSSYFTGSDTMTILIVLALLLCVAFLFRMPEVLVVVALLPIFIVFSFVDPSYWPILGVLIIIAGSALFALFRR